MYQHGCYSQVRYLGLQKSNQHQQGLKNLHLLWQKKVTRLDPFFSLFASLGLASSQVPGSAKRWPEANINIAWPQPTKPKPFIFGVKLRSSTSFESSKIRLSFVTSLSSNLTRSAFGCHGPSGAQGWSSTKY